MRVIRLIRRKTSQREIRFISFRETTNVNKRYVAVSINFFKKG